jgi:hypothetical protein
VDVGGIAFALVAHIHGNVLKGNWKVAVYMNDKATPAQKQAILNAWTGKHAGPPADLAHLVGEVVGVHDAPMEFQQPQCHPGRLPLRRLGGTPTPAVHDPVERWLYGGALLGLIRGAWIAMGLLSASADVPYFSHDFAGIDVRWPVEGRLAIFVADWTLMSTAMMLPSSLPLVTGFHTMMRRASLVSFLLAGYLCVWALFGAAVFFADAVLHELLEAIPGVNDRTDLIALSLLLATDLFQFSPLKYACFKQCRSPLGFLDQRWRGGWRSLRAFTVGMQYGLFRVG